jgi:hypothetical protein
MHKTAANQLGPIPNHNADPGQVRPSDQLTLAWAAVARQRSGACILGLSWHSVQTKSYKPNAYAHARAQTRTRTHTHAYTTTHTPTRKRRSTQFRCALTLNRTDLSPRPWRPPPCSEGCWCSSHPCHQTNPYFSICVECVLLQHSDFNTHTFFWNITDRKSGSRDMERHDSLSRRGPLAVYLMAASE